MVQRRRDSTAERETESICVLGTPERLSNVQAVSHEIYTRGVRRKLARTQAHESFS